jgi:hypothetical protein
MRYEHFDLSLSTAGCALLLDIIGNAFDGPSETTAECDMKLIAKKRRGEL